MSKRPQAKTVHEAFTQFFENPTRLSLSRLLEHHVGELRACDFKEMWPSSPQIAKHVLALGNAGGGCLLVGLREVKGGSVESVGLAEFRDKADIMKGLQPFVPQKLLDAIEIADFSYDASEYERLIGKKFQVVFVHPRLEALPFISERAGEGIRIATAYVRREGATEPATYSELQHLVDQRIAASPKSSEARGLRAHLEELRVLYSQVPRQLTTGRNQLEQIIASSGFAMTGLLRPETVPNPAYPQEDLVAFVVRMIAKKKAVIEALLTDQHD